jgi:hypothetical protein
MGMQEWLPRGQGRLEKCSRDFRRADGLILDFPVEQRQREIRGVVYDT